MPELPDVEGYIAALRVRIVGCEIERLSVLYPFILRSVEPPIDGVEQACPACSGMILRIRYADNETNYCPACQT